jgi:4a-hydroxytetrahydrobiopterin dehydratase
MKLFSPRGKGKPLSRATAKNAALLNLLATPGLGSLIARRWIEGTGQLLVFLSGFVIYCIWVFKNLAQYYSLMFNDVQPQSIIGWSRMAWTGVALCVAAWVWSAVTSLSLSREAAANITRSLQNFAAPPVQKLADAKIISALASVPNWKLQGAEIVRTFEFKDFPAAIKFVEVVAALAEEAWHHPDIDIRWNKVTLTLTTHDADGLTEKDFALAQKFDKL